MTAPTTHNNSILFIQCAWCLRVRRANGTEYSYASFPDIAPFKLRGNGISHGICEPCGKQLLNEARKAA